MDKIKERLSSIVDDEITVDDIVKYIIDNFNNEPIVFEEEYSDKMNYMKIMLGTLGKIKGLKDTSIKVMIAIAEYLPFITSNDLALPPALLLNKLRVSSNWDMKEYYAEITGLNIRTVERAFKDLLEANILFQLPTTLKRNTIYYVNPKYILRGVDKAQNILIKNITCIFNNVDK